MLLLKFRICHNQFYVKPRHQKLGHDKICSLKYRHESQKTGVWKKCHTCGKEIWKNQTALKKSSSGYFFCNRSCSMSWKNAELRASSNHPLWKGGGATYRGRLLRKGGKISCCRCGNNDERVLETHHKDHNRQHNSLDNLVWLCRNCHYSTRLKENK